MRAFLEAAQASDLEGMRSQVFPLLTVTSAHLDEAAAFLGDAEVGDLVMWQTQPVHDRFIFRVTTADDEVLSEWEVGEMEEPHLGCYAVSWGDPPPDGPSPTPSSRAE